ncbi:M56 family metallopeptidase [Pseudobacteroides cellulosolvens]|uniref:Peptidase M56 BlaR1 n=1 Tax=Pseudobacteroides cellulosolvens ATCC 35603 = DSM 2933 TaxID=398512 RepID=A0A0L6JUV7_9FIRM|nr:M56 family metallopeptidase [Pseudobacteroides cellulosolvens]KNY29613.1 peptidase M56 BlaR1 [Pseudobacteroides cellulosolvens ATCC 35603 = DSM 2933]
MLVDAFNLLINMSVTASIAAVLIVLLRWVLGSRLPKTFSYVLWAIVLIRLLIPFSLPSMFSIFNTIHLSSTISQSQYDYKTNNILPDTIHGSISMEKPGGNLMNSINSFVPPPNPEASVDPIQVQIFILPMLWLFGAVGLFTFSVFAYLRASARFNEAVLYKNDNLVFQCRQKIKLNRKVPIYTSDRVHTPIVYGLIKPRVILPLSITENSTELELRYFITHELVHIKRFDHILKPLSVFALCLHWFNPIIWFSFILSHKDMEMACDEKVLSVFDTDIRSEYASSLIKLSVKKDIILNGGLLAFGESSIKSRIKGIMRFKKYGFFMGIVSIIILIVIGAVLLTNGQHNDTSSKGQNLKSDNNFSADSRFEEQEGKISLKSDAIATNTKKDNSVPSINNRLWEKGGWTYYLEQISRGGVVPLDNYVGRFYRQNSDGNTETLDELVAYRNGSAVIFPAGDRIVFMGFAGTDVMDFKTNVIVSIREDGSERKTFNTEFNGGRHLCYDNGFLYFEGWTNDGTFPRPVCRLDTKLTKNIKMADIDGSFITVYNGYAYYLNGSIYRLKLDWVSKPEIWDKAAIGKKIVSIEKTADNEYKVFYDENSKPYILRLPDKKRKAFNVIQKYFMAFENSDFKSMMALATEYHNKNLVHDGDVWGMKWARAKEIKLVDKPEHLTSENPESTLAYGVSVDMETVKTSSQYPSTSTYFFVILVKDSNGTWRVDRYATG